jgi:hypothetical protein
MSKPPPSKSLSDALKRLQTALYADSGPQESSKEHRICSSTSESVFVDIFIAFDEVDTLAKTFDKNYESYYTVLRRTLHSLSPSCSLFTFFLSTTSIPVLPQSREQGPDSSSRIYSGTVPITPSYIYLGFDQLMQSCKVFDRWKTLDDVTSLECAARMGRPL